MQTRILIHKIVKLFLLLLTIIYARTDNVSHLYDFFYLYYNVLICAYPCSTSLLLFSGYFEHNAQMGARLNFSPNWGSL